MHRLILTTLLGSLVSLVASANGVAAAQAKPAAPAASQHSRAAVLIARDGNTEKPLALTKADIHILLDGYLAQTTATLTFRNDGNRVLEGELIFPLPDGATVTGYGIDVNGQIVDGVAVEKQMARVTYEKEVHKGIDPGLMEHVSGNTFRTRIYPIRPMSTRSIKVQYVSDLASDKTNLVYSLPLDWGQPVKECKVRVDAIKSAAAPVVRGQTWQGMKFEKSTDGFSAEQTIQDIGPAGELALVLPPPPQPLAIERHVIGLRTVDDPPDAPDKVDHYFTINTTPPPAQAPVAKPARIGILWDASMSRQGSDRTREIQLLKSALTAAGDVDVDLVFFRNVVESPQTFSIRDGKIDPLLHSVQTVVYDGGTDMAAIRMPRNYSELPGALAVKREIPDYAYWLLFTDGNGDLSDNTPPKADVPVYCISNDNRSNNTLLRRLAQQSGGTYLNLTRLTDAQAAAAIGKPPFGFVSADFDHSKIGELYPSGSQPVQGRFTIAGKLLAPEATITIHFGYGTTVTSSQSFTLRRSEALREALVPRQWAQMKVAELAMFPEKNHDALLQVGRDFNLVTPVTSLLVLETADQYVLYHISPPKSRPDVCREFAQKIEQHRADERQTREQKVQQVLAMWNERVQWYEAKHTYAANFKYVQPPQQQGAPATVLPAEVAQRGTVAGRDVPVAARIDRAAAPARSNDVRDLSVADDSARAFDEAPQFSLDTTRRESARKGGEMEIRRRLVAGNVDGESDVFGLARGRPGTQPSDGARRPAAASPAAAGETAEDIGVQIKPWDPNTPYLKAMKAVDPAKAYGAYLEQRKTFGSSPAFYFDCADYLLRAGERDLGIRVLTDVAELQLEDARLLRIVAHRLDQLGCRGAAIDLFRKILQMRPEEPQSHRDLALALADRADDVAGNPRQTSQSAAADYSESLSLLNTVIIGDWDRFQGIQVVALMEANRIIDKLRSAPGGKNVSIPLDRRMIRDLDLDLRVVMTWDTDNTDVDLWVTEPSGEKCFYQHNRTTIGGLLSTDFTDGYGPEEYCLRKLMPGAYHIEANFFGSRQQALVGPTTVNVTVITNFGRPNENRRHLTLRLTDMKEVVKIGSVTLK